MVASADGYVTGIEPGTNFPNPRTFETEQGRVVKLQAGEAWTAQVSVDWLKSAAEVTAVEQAIGKLQGSVTPTVHSQPKPEWTP